MTRSQTGEKRVIWSQSANVSTRLGNTRYSDTSVITSHSALRRAADSVRGQLGGRWPLLIQGDGQRDQLLRRFREAGSAILLGTDSFWEGVDVPGRALRVLIIAKLPFKVPSDPLTAARLERLTDAGVDGFTH